MKNVVSVLFTSILFMKSQYDCSSVRLDPNDAKFIVLLPIAVIMGYTAKVDRHNDWRQVCDRSNPFFYR